MYPVMATAADARLIVWTAGAVGASTIKVPRF
jgi:hypothetical protein